MNTSAHYTTPSDVGLYTHSEKYRTFLARIVITPLTIANGWQAGQEQRQCTFKIFLSSCTIPFWASVYYDVWWKTVSVLYTCSFFYYPAIHFLIHYMHFSVHRHFICTFNFSTCHFIVHYTHHCTLHCTHTYLTLTGFQIFTPMCTVLYSWCTCTACIMKQTHTHI